MPLNAPQPLLLLVLHTVEDPHEAPVAQQHVDAVAAAAGAAATGEAPNTQMQMTVPPPPPHSMKP